MGVVKNLTSDIFPKQRNTLGVVTTLLFHYDTSKPIKAKVVRDDSEEPFRTLFEITEGSNNGMIILSTECQYSPYSKNK